MNGKVTVNILHNGCGIKRSWPILREYFGICLERGTGKRKGIPVFNQTPRHEYVSCAWLSTTPWRHMGSGGVAPLILHHGIRWRLVSSFTSHQGKSSRYPMDRKLVSPQRWCRGGEENFLSVAGIETRSCSPYSSHCTDSATPASTNFMHERNFRFLLTWLKERERRKAMVFCCCSLNKGTTPTAVTDNPKFSPPPQFTSDNFSTGKVRVELQALFLTLLANVIVHWRSFVVFHR
jgi:hypothetical protein